MSRKQFKLPIGAKRQVTLPREFMEMLSLEEGGELLLETDGDQTTLTPMISLPRTALPEELRLRFESRRGRKATDVPLAQLLHRLGGEAALERTGSVAVSGTAGDTRSSVRIEGEKPARQVHVEKYRQMAEGEG